MSLDEQDQDSTALVHSVDWHRKKLFSERKSRALIACEPCKRRKTKCSGRPGPCTSCRKADYICRFDRQPEPSNKLATSVSNTQCGELYLLHGTLQALKYGSEESLMDLLQTLRQNESHGKLVESLRSNIELLQDRGVIAKIHIEEADLDSLATKSLSNQLSWGGKPPTLGHTPIARVRKDIRQYRHQIGKNDGAPIRFHADRKDKRPTIMPDCTSTRNIPSTSTHDGRDLGLEVSFDQHHGRQGPTVGFSGESEILPLVMTQSMGEMAQANLNERDYQRQQPVYHGHCSPKGTYWGTPHAMTEQELYGDNITQPEHWFTCPQPNQYLQQSYYPAMYSIDDGTQIQLPQYPCY